MCVLFLLLILSAASEDAAIAQDAAAEHDARQTYIVLVEAKGRRETSLARRQRLGRELGEIRGYWSRLAKQKGILSEKDLLG